MPVHTVKTIASHNGGHHADDVFGVAIMRAIFPDARIIRTRDAALISQADVAIDVGGEWDPERGRYDHHQKGFSGARENGVVYASAGLIWADVGEHFIGKMAGHLNTHEIKSVHRSVDEQLVVYLDMEDTGAQKCAPDFFGLSALVHTFNLTRWEERFIESQASDEEHARQLVEAERDKRFLEAADHVVVLVTRLVTHLAGELADAAVVRKAEKLANGRILLLSEPGVSWNATVCAEMPDVQFVVYPDSSDRQYQVRTVPVEPQSFEARVDLPRAWAGLRGQELAEVTGVPDSVFCHNRMFIAGAGSRAGALRLAELALSK